jgi:hypothetical protein
VNLNLQKGGYAGAGDPNCSTNSSWAIQGGSAENPLLTLRRVTDMMNRSAPSMTFWLIGTAIDEDIALALRTDLERFLTQ